MKDSTGRTGPLAGLRIIEIGHMLAGPYCGLLLADLGAEIIKVETNKGDISRSIGPNYIGEHNIYFASLNRNKKSVQLDIATDDGRHKFNHLVSTASALICNLRPGAIRKLGLTYDALKEINPKLTCVALTGFGLEGPYSDLPAYDYVIQALSGITMLTGNPGNPPTRVGYSVVDNTAGMMGAIGVLAKLVEGKGGQVDIALYDTLISQFNYIAGAWLNAGEKPRRQVDGGHAYIVPAQFFATSDGHVALFITHDRFWRDFSTEVGMTEWIEDPDFATMEARSKNRDVVVNAVKEIMMTDTTSNWLNRLQPLGIVIAGVRGMEEALVDTHVSHRDMVIQIPTPSGCITLVGNPVKISGFQTQYHAPPGLGEHNSIIPG